MSKKRTKKKTEENEHGGRRKGSGRPSIFRGKSASSLDPMYGNVPEKISLRLTRKGLTKLDALAAKRDMSRNDFVEGLIHVYGPHITREQIEGAAGT